MGSLLEKWVAWNDPLPTWADTDQTGTHTDDASIRST